MDWIWQPLIGNLAVNALTISVWLHFRRHLRDRLTHWSPIAMTDHLSPSLARLLLVEPLNRLVPGQWMQGDRAQILTESFSSVAKDPGYMRKAISDSFDPTGARPAVVSVSIDVASGRRLVMAPFQMDSFAGTAQWWPWEDL